MLFLAYTKRAENIAICATRSTAAGAACPPPATVFCAIVAGAAGGVGFEVVKNAPKNPPSHFCKRSIIDMVLILTCQLLQVQILKYQAMSSYLTLGL